MLMPLYTEETHSLFESLTEFFSHGWHFNVLFSSLIPETKVIEPGNLLYLISASLSESNLRFLHEKIERISFEDLRRPTIQTNSALHDCREDLVFLRAAVTETHKYMPPPVHEWFKSAINDHQNMYLGGEWMNLQDTFARIIEDADKLSAFLMDSFQLLMSTISTLDSQISLEQARRATLLTQLAFIYVPLSFVTGIYGMNVKEINGSPLSLWVAVVSLLVIVACTAGIFWVLTFLEDCRYSTKNLSSRGVKSMRSAKLNAKAIGDIEMNKS
jgi:hypothetical protein